jgi:hypothetical protein
VNELVAALRPYYREPQVRKRILDFLGGPRLSRTTAIYVSTHPVERRSACRRSPHGLWRALEEEPDLERSLWDERSLIADLDLEYVNFDRPGEAFADPAYCYEVQRPVVEALLHLVEAEGIPALHSLSGRGHHLVWRIDRGSHAFERLVGLGRLAARPAPTVDPRGELAHLGLGMVLEHLAQRAMADAAGRCALPVEVTAVEAGPSARGREVVSIDLSEFGDPLSKRTLRVPFGANLKSYRSGRIAAPVVSVPLVDLDEREALPIMRDLRSAAALAARTRTLIPEGSEGTSSLLDSYEASDVAAFHRFFYSREAEATAAESAALGQLLRKGLPPCVGTALEAPNDLLLRPAVLQQVTRTLLALGFHPRAIAGLVRSRYAADHQWSGELHFHDGDLRADFYVRLFCALIWGHRDDLVDFNCRSTQEKRYCLRRDCDFNLAEFRASLLARREHGRLAGGPVYGLLSPH